MTGNPISRIYFDSNCAFGWPAVSKDFHWVIILARWLSVELYWPEAVEIELEAQFLRDIKDEAEKVAAGQKRIIKRLRAVDADASSRFEVDLALAGETYKQKAEVLKANHAYRSRFREPWEVRSGRFRRGQPSGKGPSCNILSTGRASSVCRRSPATRAHRTGGEPRREHLARPVGVSLDVALLPAGGHLHA